MKPLLLEEWKEIEGFPGYKISNLGRVASPLGRELNIQHTGDKYKEAYIVLTVGGKRCSRHIAQLVYLHFSEKKMKYQGSQVLHIDGNPDNNRIDNLRTALTVQDAVTEEQRRVYEEWCLPSIKLVIKQQNINALQIDVDNFIGEAALALWKYLPLYDPKRYKFITWAKRYIRWALLKELEKKSKYKKLITRAYNDFYYK